MDLRRQWFCRIMGSSMEPSFMIPSGSKNNPPIAAVVDKESVRKINARKVASYHTRSLFDTPLESAAFGCMNTSDEVTNCCGTGHERLTDSII